MKTFGTLCGIVGALLVATKHGQFGYPFFLASSLALLIVALRARDRDYVMLQGVFLGTNLLGFYNYVMA